MKKSRRNSSHSPCRLARRTLVDVQFGQKPCLPFISSSSWESALTSFSLRFDLGQRHTAMPPAGNPAPRSARVLLDAVDHRTDLLVGGFRGIPQIDDRPRLDGRNLLQGLDSVTQLFIENRGAFLDGLLAHLLEIFEKFSLQLLDVLADLILDQTRADRPSACSARSRVRAASAARF